MTPDANDSLDEKAGRAWCSRGMHAQAVGSHDLGAEPSGAAHTAAECCPSLWRQNSTSQATCSKGQSSSQDSLFSEGEALAVQRTIAVGFVMGEDLFWRPLIVSELSTSLCAIASKFKPPDGAIVRPSVPF